MSSENIFIHIPKTGGTTINCVINKTEWQTKPDFFYRHILYETKKSNSADIFNPLNYDKYRNYNIFMIVRHPIDRIISEYFFIKDREEFMSLLHPRPNSLKDYIKNKQTNNYMIGFLLGKRMYDTDYVNDDDLNLVQNTINQLNIKVGIFEDYQKLMMFFSKTTGIKLPKHIDIKRITLNRPSLNEISEEIKTLIIKYNQLDLRLYEFCVEKFRSDVETLTLKDTNFKFVANKYNYVLKYTERFIILEIALKNKLLLKAQQPFFVELNLHLHHVLKLKSGEVYVKIWNSTFLKAIKNAHLNSALEKELSKAYEHSEDELQKTINFCSILDLYINRGYKPILNQPLNFNESLIDKSLLPKKSFFSFFK